MRLALQIISWLALVALILPSAIFLAGRLELDQVKWVMLAASIIWFIAATPWMWQETREEEPEKDEVVVP
jgi:hypothetical protein